MWLLPAKRFSGPGEVTTELAFPGCALKWVGGTKGRPQVTVDPPGGPWQRHPGERISGGSVLSSGCGRRTTVTVPALGVLVRRRRVRMVTFKAMALSPHLNPVVIPHGVSS